MVEGTVDAVSYTHLDVYKRQLVGHIIKGAVFMEEHGILCIERGTHVETVEPHLVGINFLVPEASFFGAGMRAELITQMISRFLVFFFSGYPIE